jgi:hypothetical protein
MKEAFLKPSGSWEWLEKQPVYSCDGGEKALGVLLFFRNFVTNRKAV